MQLGIYLDLRNPPHWRRLWPELYRAAIDRVVEGERLGLGSVWLSEHHLFDDGYLPQPLTFAATLATRTTRIRIGTAVVLAALRHPRHIAEEAALVDVLSEGRLELGLGTGYAAPEFAPFGADVATRVGRTEAAVIDIQRMFDEGAVAPPPVQQPLPLWLGHQGPKGAQRAGRLGVGLLSLDRALLPAYRDGRASVGLDPDGGRMAGVLDILVSEDPPRTLERVLPHLAHHLNSYRIAMTAGAQRRTPRPLTPDEILATRTAPGAVRGLSVLTAEETVKEVRERTRGLPVAHVFFWASIAGMPDDIVDRHIELLATEVRPALGTDRERA